MLFEEKRRIEADICLLPQVKEENVSSEESNEESATVEEGSTEETVVDVEELHPEEPAEWHVTTSEEAKEGEEAEEREEGEEGVNSSSIILLFYHLSSLDCCFVIFSVC